MVGKMLLLYAVLCCDTVKGQYNSSIVVPSEEDESCPEGDEIPCGSVIDTNNTFLRYERGNISTVLKPQSSSLPSQDCPWTLRGPPGTHIRLETTCFHHFHNNYSDEHRVCSNFEYKVDNEAVTSRGCAHGYYEFAISPHNEENFSVYYENGFGYAMGFTAKIMFLGEPVVTKTTTTTTTTTMIESTTSGGNEFIVNYAIIVFVAVIAAILPAW